MNSLNKNYLTQFISNVFNHLDTILLVYLLGISDLKLVFLTVEILIIILNYNTYKESDREYAMKLVLDKGAKIVVCTLVGMLLMWISSQVK